MLEKPEPLVLAAGGSIVGAPVSWDRLRNYTKTVWLHANPTTYLDRVRSQGDLRPMKGRDNALIELKQLLAVRTPLYAQADVHMDTESKEVEMLVHDLSKFYQGSV